MENFLKPLSAPALLLLAVAALSPAPAAAQPFVEGWAGTFHEDLDGVEPVLPVAQVRRILWREGVRLIGLPHVRGGEIIAIGRDNFGARKRVVLDSQTGEVLDVTLIDPPRQGPDGMWRGDAPRERRGQNPGGEFDGGGRPLPPPVHSRGEGAPGGPGMDAGANQGVNPAPQPRGGEAQPNRPQRQPNEPVAARPAAPIAPRSTAAPVPAQAAAPAAPVPAPAPAVTAPAPVQAQAAPTPANPAPARNPADHSMSPIKPLHPDGAPSRPAEGAPKVAPLPN